MHRFRVLVLAKDELSSVGNHIQKHLANVDVVEVTTPDALGEALQDCAYHAVCVQLPFAWMSTHSLIQVLRQRLPSCPLVPFRHKDTAHLIASLAAVPEAAPIRSV